MASTNSELILQWVSDKTKWPSIKSNYRMWTRALMACLSPKSRATVGHLLELSRHPLHGLTISTSTHADPLPIWDSNTALTVSTEFPASCTPAEHESGNWAMCPVLPGNFEVRSALHHGKRSTREDNSNPTCSTIIWRIFWVLHAWERLYTILQPMVWSSAFIDSWKVRLDAMPLNVGLRCAINPLGHTSSSARGLRHILLRGSMANHCFFWDISSLEDG